MALQVRGKVHGIKEGGPLTLRDGTQVTERPKVRLDDGDERHVVIGPLEWVRGFAEQVGKEAVVAVVARPGFRPGTVTLYAAGTDDDGW